MKHTTRVSRNPFTLGRGNRYLITAATFVVGLLFVGGMLFSSSSISTTKVQAAPDFQGGATQEMLDYALNLGAASDLAVFGGRSVRNSGQSTFRGKIGSTGQIIGVPGIPDGASPESFGQAKQDMQRAMSVIAQLPCADVASGELAGKTFTPGVYCLSSAELTGEMVLSAAGDVNARFVFRIAGDLTTGPGSHIRLADGARASSVYIVAGGSVTLGAESRINANIISNNAIMIGNGSTVSAKTIGLEGEVRIESSNIGNGTGFI